MSLNNTITKNNINVIKHRLSKDEVPNFNRLKRIARHIPQKDLKEYIKKAKKSYDELLLISKESISSNKEVLQDHKGMTNE